MLRRLLWNGLFTLMAAGATLLARRAATTVWRKATGEEPPTR